MRLFELLELKFALGQRRRRPDRQLLAGAAVGVGGLGDAALEGADFVGPRHQRLARFIEQVFGRAGAGLKRLEARVLLVDFLDVLVMASSRAADSRVRSTCASARAASTTFSLASGPRSASCRLRQTASGLRIRRAPCRAKPAPPPLIVGLHRLLLRGLAGLRAGPRACRRPRGARRAGDSPRASVCRSELCCLARRCNSAIWVRRVFISATCSTLVRSSAATLCCATGRRPAAGRRRLRALVAFFSAA